MFLFHFFEFTKQLHQSFSLHRGEIKRFYSQPTLNLNKATNIGSRMPFRFSSVVVDKEILAFLKLILALQHLKVCCSLQVHRT